MVDNADWLDALEYIPFLREFGSRFSVNRMLAMDSVKRRLDREQPLSFLEFNYMVLQAYDFLELARRHGCVLQIGGSDQWGNIVNGVELGRRVDDRTLYGLTSPLLIASSGEKMGKTADGAVWLKRGHALRLRLLAVLRNTDDADVGRFLRLFTELPLERDRTPRFPSGRGDQRGEKDPRERGHRPLPRPGSVADGRGDGPRYVRRRRIEREPAGNRRAARRTERRRGGVRAVSSRRPLSEPRRARRLIKGAADASTTSPSETRRNRHAGTLAGRRLDQAVGRKETARAGQAVIGGRHGRAASVRERPGSGNRAYSLRGASSSAPHPPAPHPSGAPSADPQSPDTNDRRNPGARADNGLDGDFRFPDRAVDGVGDREDASPSLPTKSLPNSGRSRAASSGCRGNQGSPQRDPVVRPVQRSLQG